MGRIKILLIALSLAFISYSQVFASDPFNVANSDNVDRLMFGFFDLRDRETYIQVTNTDGVNSHNVHIQIFNVADNCNENNFFDLYTPNDTHVYNLRDILTNDGNDSGVVLPSDAYGIFVALVVNGSFEDSEVNKFIGNIRIEDNSGYEYRTNLLGTNYINGNSSRRTSIPFATFNFNNEGGVTLSDITFITYSTTGSPFEIRISNILENWYLMDVDIYDLNENPFSCRNVIFSCVDEDNPLLESLLEEVPDSCCGNGSANVASFEYGINESIQHSKGGELLCPGNTIPEGFVRLHAIKHKGESLDLLGFVGLNNGNGRGSMDAMISQNGFSPFPIGN